MNNAPSENSTPASNTRLVSEFGFQHKLLRFVWGIAWGVLFYPTPRFFSPWRCWLLRRFGARIGKNASIASSAKIWYPPNLILKDAVVIGPDVDLYCVAPIVIGERSIISQYSYLCSASHDYEKDNMPLISKPISIGSSSWICSKAFVGPGVSIGNSCVVGACAVVMKDVDSHFVVAGNPAKTIKQNKIVNPQ